MGKQYNLIHLCEELYYFLRSWDVVYLYLYYTAYNIFKKHFSSITLIMSNSSVIKLTLKGFSSSSSSRAISWTGGGSDLSVEPGSGMGTVPGSGTSSSGLLSRSTSFSGIAGGFSFSGSSSWGSGGATPPSGAPATPSWLGCLTGLDWFEVMSSRVSDLGRPPSPCRPLE